MGRRVVVIGGGFAGVAAVTSLRKEPVEITLIDRRNHHLFQPLLYQVATASLAPTDIAEPLRALFAKQQNVEVRLAEVDHVDVAGRAVVLGGGERVPYDVVVVAAGAGPSYFGNDDWAEAAPALKSLADALEIRQRMLTAFERAEWTDDPEERRALTTFVVVGAGPTGVELAGALAEIAHRMQDEFRHFDSAAARVVLVEGGPAVLPPYPEKLQDKAQAQLESLGVEVRLDAMVSEVDDAGVTIGETERIEARTVLWAAGVKASELGGTLGVETTKAGKVAVTPQLTLPDHPEVFVIGDMAHVEQDGEPVPGLAPAAQQMGKHVGKALAADRKGKAREPFRYWDKGSMATVGHSRAVMDALGVQIGGFVAWVLWGVVHLATLLTSRNRILVFIKWVWAWLTRDRASRLLWEDQPDLGDTLVSTEEDRRAS